MKNTAFVHIASVMVIAFICFFSQNECPAQAKQPPQPKPVVVMSEEDKAMSKILEQEEKARNAVEAATEEHGKCPYKCKVITDATATAEKSLEIQKAELEKLKKLKTGLDEEVKKLDDKKNKTKAETDKLAELKKRQADVEQKVKAGEILVSNTETQVKTARELAHGLVTADEIGEIAEGMRENRITIDSTPGESDRNRREREKMEKELNDNAQKILDEIGKEANAAAAKDPCDAEAVRDAVNKKLAELYKKYVDDERNPAKKAKMAAWFAQHFYIATKKDRVQPHIETEGGGEPNGKTERRQGLSYISIRPAECPPPALFSPGITGGADFAPGLSAALFGRDDLDRLAQSVYEQPDLVEALFSAHGSEWVIGPSAEGGFFVNERREAERRAGVQATLRIGRHAGLQTGIDWGQTTAKADFQVRSLTNGAVSTGAVQTTLKRMHAQATLRYYSGVRHPLQVFAGIGMQFSRQSAGSLEAQWGPAHWKLRDISAANIWAGVAQAGLLFSPRHFPLGIELSGGVRAPLSDRFDKRGSPFAQIALGLRF